MLFPLYLSPPIPLLHFRELGLERFLPPALSRSVPLRLKYLRLEFHHSHLVTTGLNPFRLHVKDNRLLDDG